MEDKKKALQQFVILIIIILVVKKIYRGARYSESVCIVGANIFHGSDLSNLKLRKPQICKKLSHIHQRLESSLEANCQNKLA